MKIIYKDKTKRFVNSKACFGFEYPFKDKDINGAVIELKGRYPDKGRVVNLKCKELVYIIKGSGKIVVEGKQVEFSKGDLILLKPNEKYYWQATCLILAVCVPAFNPNQHRHVE
ncbi:cupin domain-containing protein [Patescibacteria group bacterium]